MKKGEHTYLQVIGRKPEQIRVDNRTYTKKGYNTSFIDLGYSNDNCITRVLLPPGKNIYAIVGSYPQERMEKIAFELRQKEKQYSV